MSDRPSTPCVGEIQPSQLLYSFGVGAMIDLPSLSVIVMGLDDWDPQTGTPIEEERLLALVRRDLGPQVQRMVMPPVAADDELASDPFDPQSRIGVPVAVFPRWLRCPHCEFLSEIRSELFRWHPDEMRPDANYFFYSGCEHSGVHRKPALPARFLVACDHGHLDDFPWMEFVHRVAQRGPSTCVGRLRLYDRTASGEARDVRVRCDACDADRTMADALGEEARTELPRCRGRRPHLRDFDPAGCGEPLHTILLGASNSWFPLPRSALSIPESSDRFDELVREHWSTLREVRSPEILLAFRSAFRGLGPSRVFDAFADDAKLLAAIERRRATLHGSRGDVPPPDIRSVEWNAFTHPSLAPSSEDFLLREERVGRHDVPGLKRVVLAERLREVRALVGFTRVESPGDFGLDDEVAPTNRAPLSRQPPTFVPAITVRGEGLFLELDEASVATWERTVPALLHEQRLRDANFRFRVKRGLVPHDGGFPGLRYVMLHTLSHAFMRQFALECGYSMASLRERIYARAPGHAEGPMAGILIYTAAPDSEGTLGGLVHLGRDAGLERHLASALDQAALCSSDPFCAEHLPMVEDLSLHGAACHACLFSPETSCERGNRFLDRATITATLASSVPPFFENVAPA